MQRQIEELKKRIETPPLDVALVDSPDAELRKYTGVVVTSDSAILDCAACWTNLAARIVDTRVHGAWKIDLRPDCST